MAKIIKYTQAELNAIRDQAIKDFEEYISTLNKNPKDYLNGIHFNKNYTIKTEPLPQDHRQKVYITSKAYSKMLQYVLQSNLEIAWHGTVTHTNPNEYTVTDVMLYPQTVSAATVTTDQTKYETWLNELDDETFNNLRFQGHSHVNMSTTPSAVDRNYYEELINALSRAKFYIFFIMNKKQEFHIEIYDLENNILYEKADIEIIVLDEDGERILNDVEIAIKQYAETFTLKPTTNYYNSFLTSMSSNKDYLKEGAFDDFYDDLECKFTKKGKKRK